MDGSAFIGLLIVAALTIAGLLFSRAITTKWVHPLRVSLYTRVMDAAEDPATPAKYRKGLPHLLDNKQLFSLGWLVPWALWRALLRILAPARHPRPTEPAMVQIKGFEGIVVRFALSALAANPIAVVISVPLAIMVLVAGVVRHMRPKRVFAAEAGPRIFATC